MQWYGSIRLAGKHPKPPSYVVERISDLKYASELAKTSPSSARSVINEIINQLNSHMDYDYVDDLTVASNLLLDSPVSAMNLIGMVTEYMSSDKRRYEKEKVKTWKSLLK